MNTPEMLEANYTNPKIKKLIKIHKRTKNKRIKNKTFAKLLLLCVKEKDVVKYKGAAVLSVGYYNQLVQQINELSKMVSKYENLEEYHLSHSYGEDIEKAEKKEMESYLIDSVDELFESVTKGNPKQYKHFKKGTIYEEKAIVKPIGDRTKSEFFITALHSETQEEVTVYPLEDGFFSELPGCYVLYFNIEEPFKLWLREYTMFHETIEREGKVQRRFQPIN